MKQAIAWLDWSLQIDCPECEKEIDLVEYDSENDYRISHFIFNNDWDSVKGREILCPHCGEEFKIDHVEY